jgi:site-specific DNA-cytosine methylase
MKVLELFAGTRSIGKAFAARGHQVYSVEWDKRFDHIDLYADILKLTAQDVLREFGRPDVIWASPDCATFSIAAISHHRRKNPETGNLDPVSEYAKFCDAVDQHVLRLILALSPTYWFIENPQQDAQNDVDGGTAPVHRHILSVRGHPNEAHGHLDKSSAAQI